MSSIETILFRFKNVRRGGVASRKLDAAGRKGGGWSSYIMSEWEAEPQEQMSIKRA